MMNIVVTGSGGFIGKELITVLSQRSGISVAGVSRKGATKGNQVITYCKDINGHTDWGDVLSNVDVVVHLAARAHVTDDKSTDPLQEFRRTNTNGTINFAEQASLNNVKRFIFISSIGVNGNKTFGKGFSSDDLPFPIEPYAISKHEAEVSLRNIAKISSMEVVIIRPPLVYGPDAPGNFSRLMAVIYRQSFLPFGCIHSKRSFVFIENLVDLIVTCIDSSAAANQTLLVSDDNDLSLKELVMMISAEMEKPVRLLPIPNKVLWLGGIIFNRIEVVDKLCSSLQVDISRTKSILGWKPPVTVNSGVKRTVRSYYHKKEICK